MYLGITEQHERERVRELSSTIVQSSTLSIFGGTVFVGFANLAAGYYGLDVLSTFTAIALGTAAGVVVAGVANVRNIRELSSLRSDRADASLRQDELEFQIQPDAQSPSVSSQNLNRDSSQGLSSSRAGSIAVVDFDPYEELDANFLPSTRRPNNSISSTNSVISIGSVQVQGSEQRV